MASEQVSIPLPVNLTLSGDDINKMIAQAVLESRLGEVVRKAVDDKLAEIDGRKGYGGNNVVAQVVEAELRRYVVQVITTHHGDQLREYIKGAISEKVTQDFIDRLWEKVDGRL